MWPSEVKSSALVACGRRCCICHRFCGTNIECHHIVPESDGGESTLENCIPVCFDCHADVGHYNPRHPRGTKYSAAELRGHRDAWFAAMASLSRAEREAALGEWDQPLQIYEGQTVEITGFVWREAFPGSPDYEVVEMDTREVFWMLVLSRPVTLIACSPEDDSSILVEGVKNLQMILDQERYDLNRHLVLRNAKVTGRLSLCLTAHHHGDALIEVRSIEKSGDLFDD